MKTVELVIAEAEGRRIYSDVAILPNMRASDLLGRMHLSGLQLAHPNGGVFLHSEDLYRPLTDGQRLYATRADVEAG